MLHISVVCRVSYLSNCLHIVLLSQFWDVCCACISLPGRYNNTSYSFPAQSSLTLLLTDRDLDQLHCRPISQMGNYQVSASIFCMEPGVFDILVNSQWLTVLWCLIILCNGTDGTLEQFFSVSIFLLSQDYLKKMTPPLREIESTPVRQHMFGNPFKIDKVSIFRSV